MKARRRYAERRSNKWQSVGGVILQYTYENIKTFTHASSEELWIKYVTVGILPLPSERLNNEGKRWTVGDAHFPTPTKTGRGDCHM